MHNNSIAIIPKLYILIPVFNENDNIAKLLGNLLKFRVHIKKDLDVRVVFVDDGSDDQTVIRIEQECKALPITILRHDKNDGPGAAFGTGFEYLRNVLDKGDWVVTMEGDNTSRLSTLQQMLIRRFEGYNVVLASPYTYGGGFSHTPWHRVFLSHAANGSIKFFLGIRGINTFSSFFRLYDFAVLDRLYECYGSRIIEQKGFESMLELLCKMIYQKAKISEVPLEVDTSLRAGKSKMKILRTMRGYFCVILKAKTWRRISCEEYKSKTEMMVGDESLQRSLGDEKCD